MLGTAGSGETPRALRRMAAANSRGQKPNGGIARAFGDCTHPWLRGTSRVSRLMCLCKRRDRIC